MLLIILVNFLFSKMQAESQSLLKVKYYFWSVNCFSFKRRKKLKKQFNFFKV